MRRVVFVSMQAHVKTKLEPVCDQTVKQQIRLTRSVKNDPFYVWLI